MKFREFMEWGPEEPERFRTVKMLIAYTVIAVASLVQKGCPIIARGHNSDPPAVKSHHSVCEYNNYYDECGNAVFDQMVYWDWNGERFEVTAFRMIPTETRTRTMDVFDPIVRKHLPVELREAVPTKQGERMIPSKDGDKYRAYWTDKGVIRDMTFDSYIETWTQWDPELVDRQYLRREDRRELPAIPRNPLLSPAERFEPPEPTEIP